MRVSRAALTCLMGAAAVSAGALVPAVAAVTAPPPSDGSSGSFDAQFGSGATAYGGLSYWSLDTGQVVTTQGAVAFTVPFKTIKWNGQTVHAYDFSSLSVEQTIHLTLYGATPAVLVSQGDINIAGQFIFSNTKIAGGIPSTGTNNDYNGGHGQGTGGGGGGAGPGGQEETTCGPGSFSGSGGGGGGNYARGSGGRRNYVPSNIGNDQLPTYAGGAGGYKENTNVLQGGGGGAAGGGGSYNGDYYGGSPGGNGGGAVAFSTPGNLILTNTAVLNATGGAGGGASGVNGGSGGGAGGAVWLFATQSVSNAGQILANGGAGSTLLLQKSTCTSKPLVMGPNGGNGSGGVLFISSPAIANSGTINLSGGNGAATPNGGLLNAKGVPISNTGSIIGAAKTE
jgi:hypothetical protein